MQLVIGDKVFSSWSMRPWLALKRAGVPFEEIKIKLRQPDTQARIAPHSPSGFIPALKDGELIVYDSLAICEYLAERFPEKRLWPADPAARALARAAAAEMHAGFQSLRGECSMDLALHTKVELSEATGANIRRIVALFSSLRGQYADAGPFLLGEWSIADAFYTPVATRFRSYGVRLSDYGDLGPAAAYCELLLEQPDYLEWEKEALAEVAAEAS
jgi:glutathione S-transferase